MAQRITGEIEGARRAQPSAATAHTPTAGHQPTTTTTTRDFWPVLKEWLSKIYCFIIGCSMI
jgi:hypothetical protein